MTRAVEQRLAELNRTLPADVQIQQTFRQSNFIDSAIRNVSSAMVEGVVIVSAVIVLFLMNWRGVAISLSAIPLSILIGLMLMNALGLGINTMTLGGLVVAIGPEGGWSPAEEGLALEQGWQPVSLGTTILRCSTAAVAAAALLSHWRQSLVS